MKVSKMISKISFSCLLTASLLSCGNNSEMSDAEHGQEEATDKVKTVEVKPCFEDNYAFVEYLTKDSTYRMETSTGNTYARVFSTGALFILITDGELPEKPGSTIFSTLDQNTISLKLGAEFLENVPNELSADDMTNAQFFFHTAGNDFFLTHSTSESLLNETGVMETNEKKMTGSVKVVEYSENQICISGNLVDAKGQTMKFEFSAPLDTY